MLRLPVCPHCGTVYRYRDTVAANSQKKNTCYHCGGRFRVRRTPYIWIEVLILLPLCVGFNILLLTRMAKLNLVALFVSTVAFLLLGYFLAPFFSRFVKTDEKEKNNPQKRILHQENTQKKDDSAIRQKNMKQRNQKRRS